MTRSREKREGRGKEKMEVISGEAVESTSYQAPMDGNFSGGDSQPLLFHFLAFQVADQRFALPLKQVQRVLRMVALIPVPETPHVIAGLMNIHGKVIPVINLRARLGLVDRCAEVNDRILLIKTGDRSLGLIVDKVENVMAVTGDHIEKPRGSLVKSPLLQSLIRTADDVYLVLSANALDPEDFNPHSQRSPGGSSKK